MKLLYNIIFFFILSTSFGYSQIIAEHFKTKDFDIAIFSKDYKIYNSEKRFTPTKEEILLAEKELKYNLKDFFGKNSKEKFYKNLKKYKRQYFGILDDNGNKILLINAFCGSKDYWLNQIIQVDDGGSCYWEINYDISSGKLMNLYINGES